jgi:hypothetical protein
VLATFFLAGGETLLLLGFFELIWKNAGRKWAPQVFARHPSLIANPNDRVRSPGAARHSV